MDEAVGPQPGRRTYAFGPIRLDPVNRLLLDGDRSIHVTAKAFDLLLYFVEHPNRLLTKDEILASVWRDSFVEEGNVARHVSMLRKVLSEVPNDQLQIVTVAGRGYRFVANVVAADAPQVPVAPAVAAPPRRRRIAILATAMVLAALAVAGRYWVRSGSTPATDEAPSKFEWRTSTGDVYGPTISRDGIYLAYIWITPEGDQGLRVRQVASNNPIDVVAPRPVSYWALRFAPRGDFIYYVTADRAPGARGTLFRVPTLGGRSERVLDDVSGGVTASPDGEWLAFVRTGAESDSPSRVMTVHSNGTQLRTLKAFDVPAIVQSLDWAPDGRTLLYALRLREPSGEDRWQVAEIPTGGGSPNVIIAPRPRRIVAIAWLPERRGFLMNAVDPESGLPQLWRVSYPDAAERRLTDDIHEYKDLTITADGSTVVTQTFGYLVQVWLARSDAIGQPTQIALADCTRCVRRVGVDDRSSSLVSMGRARAL